MEITEQELIEKYKNIPDKLLREIIIAIGKRVNQEYKERKMDFTEKQAKLNNGCKL